MDRNIVTRVLFDYCLLLRTWTRGLSNHWVTEKLIMKKWLLSRYTLLVWCRIPWEEGPGERSGCRGPTPGKHSPGRSRRKRFRRRARRILARSEKKSQYITSWVISNGWSTLIVLRSWNFEILCSFPAITQLKVNSQRLKTCHFVTCDFTRYGPFGCFKKQNEADGFKTV